MASTHLLGKNLRQRSTSGKCAVEAAVLSYKMPLIEWLCAHPTLRADVVSFLQKSTTALPAAAAYGCIELLQWVVAQPELGPDTIRRSDDDQNSFAYSAIEKCRFGVLRWIAAEPSLGCSYLRSEQCFAFAATCSGSIELLEWIVAEPELGVTMLNQTAENGSPPAAGAAYRGHDGAQQGRCSN